MIAWEDRPDPSAPLRGLVKVMAIAETRCARRRNHRIRRGDPLVFVPGLGACCTECAS